MSPVGARETCLLVCLPVAVSCCDEQAIACGDEFVFGLTNAETGFGVHRFDLREVSMVKNSGEWQLESQ